MGRLLSYDLGEINEASISMMNSITANKDEILVLPSWYPSVHNPLAGDFVQRHIEAISLFNKQYVIYVVKDEHGSITRDIHKSVTFKNNITEEIIHYHVKKTGIRLYDRYLSDIKYQKVYRSAIKKYLESYTPEIVHVHHAMKAGLLAAWIKKEYSIPYIITEHWSAYLPEADYKITDESHIFKNRLQKIIANASITTCVSQHLANCIKKIYPEIETIVIPNVVNTSIFKPGILKKTGPLRFIHASTLTYAKNITNILQALSIINKRKIEFQFAIFGPVNEDLQNQILKFNLQGNVLLKGEVSQPLLAKEMQHSDALIQFSRFETFGCVIIEANATGLPVIVNDIPAFRELIRENENGLFSKSSNYLDLAEKIMEFIEKKTQFDQTKITSYSQKYSYETVAERFSELYTMIKNKKNETKKPTL